MPPTTNPQPYVAPAYDSARKQADDSKKGMLEAVAQGGQAGATAYQQSIDAAGADRQAAVARAAESSALGYQSDPNVALRSYDDRIGLMQTSKASNQGYFDALGASGSSYFDKLKGGIGASEAMAINKASGQERTIQAAIEQARIRAEAEAAEEAAKIQAQIDRENRAEARTLAREGRAEARASAKEAAKGPDISIEGLLGKARQIQKPVDFGPGQQPGESIEQYIARLNQGAQVRRDTESLVGPIGQSQTDMAASIGRVLGVPENKLAELYGPTATNKVAPTKDAVAQSLATKYDTKGVTYDLAKSALGGEDFKTFVNWIQGGADGATQEEATQKIGDFFLRGVGRKGGNPGAWTAEYEILLGEYVPRLPKD